MKKSVCRFVPVLFLLITLALPASAAVYDFSNLGAASGGFKPQGNRFLVTETFTNDGTSMYYNDSVNSTVTDMVIKPDGTNLSSFDLGNMTISPYGGTYTVSIAVHADLKAGGTTSQSVSNYGLTAATSLTAMGMNFSAFNDVTELRIDLTVVSSLVYNINFDNITITDEQAPVASGTTPTVQASNLKAASNATTVINIYWQNGNGTKRIVFAKQANTGAPTVTDGIVYTANADFSAATDIGGGWKCVYRDTGHLLSITGLAANTEYRMVVYEFDGTGGGEAYLTSIGTNIINHSTSPAGLDKKDFSSLGAASGGFKPQGGRYLVSETFTNDGTSMYYNDSGASVTGMVIKPNATTLFSFDLVDLELIPYDADRTVTVTVTADLKAGGTTSQTVNNFTMYLGIPYSLSFMGMDFSAFNDVTELRFDITTDQVLNINFGNITISDPDEYVLGTEPTTQASGLKVASTSTTTMDVYWVNGNGTSRIMFIKAGNTGTPTVTDGTEYTADANFGTAADIGGGWKCVYIGTENHTRIAGLSAGTEYRTAVYEFDGSGGGENYLTATGTNIINHTTDPAGLPKYDFSALGAASGGFKPQGNRFLVSDTFTNDITSMYYSSSNATETGIVIKPDGTNLSMFDLGDMEFSPYGADRVVSITITADLNAGGTTSQSISSFTMYNGLAYSLALLGLDFSAFVDVTELRFDITVTGGSVNQLNFDNITLGGYKVAYDGNGNTGGAVPTDGSSYADGDTVTVLGNTGSLVRTGYTFAGWNTAADGSGTSYTGGDTFAIGLSNVTLYAQWTAIDYTVTYDGNTNTGGAVPTDGNTYNITNTVTVLGNTGSLVKTSYTFSGWNTAANGSGTSYNGGDTFAMGSSNVTLYAQWTEITYSVTYNGNSNTGGAVPTDGTSYHYTDTATVLGNTGSLVRTGYTFTGWNTAADGSGTSYTGGDTFAIGLSNVTLYAQWSAVNYAVTYNGNTNTGGAAPTDGNTYHITDTVTVLGNTGSLVKTGYTFNGWNTAANGSGTSYNGGDTFAMGSSNVTLYAQWTAIPYSVTYNGNTNTGGAVPVDGTVYTYGDTATVLGNTGSLVRTGYTFAGWNTVSNGSGTSYTGGDTFGITGNVTLYARWTAIDYTVTYNGNTNTGGSVPVDGNTYNITNTVTVLGNTGSLVKTGYTFAGWNTAANGSGTGYTSGDTFAMGSSNVTLYAQWTAIPYSVTYNGNTNSGGSVPVDGNTYNITNTVTVLGNTGSLVKTGHTFSGWNTAANGSGTGYTGGDTFAMGAGDVTLYAQWTINNYILTVNSGVGDGTYPFEDVVTIAADPPAAGLVFDQWTGDTGTVANIYQPNTTVTIPDGNVIVTATYKDPGTTAYSLTVVDGSGSGDYLPGDTVTLAADAPSPGMVFDQWTGDTATIVNVNLPDTTLFMPGAVTTVTATFKAQGAVTYPLTVTSGSGSGDYLPGETVLLAADPSPAGMVFDQWTGDTATLANINLPDTTLVMPSSAAAVTAEYKTQGAATFTLTVNDGTGGGNYLPGVNVAISATVPVGHTFSHWTGQTAWVADTNQADTTLTMPAADISVTAVAPINTYTLTYTAGSGGSVVGPNPQTVDYGTDGAAVRAMPRSGYHFVRWSDGVAGAYRTDLNVTADLAATAVFARNIYVLEYAAGANGRISGISPQRVSHGGDGSEVLAVPDPGYDFVQWDDGSVENPRLDTDVTSNILVTAVFEEAVNTFTLDYTAGDHGAIIGDSYQTIRQGADGSPVTASPDEGYRFLRWSDGVTTATRRDINVMADIAVSAEFTVIWTPGEELPDDLDLDGNGIPDGDQNNIAVVSNGSGLYFGVVLPDEIMLEYLEWVDDATVPDTTNRPDAFPLGLVSFRVLTAFIGDTVELTIYCSQPIPEGAIWYKHDSVNGWYDYTAHAVISGDRMSVTLTLQDGGIGDADGIANGVIEDPSGPALFISNDGDGGGDDTGANGGGGGGGGCFLQTLCH